MRYLQLLAVILLAWHGQVAFSKPDQQSDKVLVVHNDTAYEYAVSPHLATTVTQHTLLNINKIIADDTDSFFLGKKCGDVKNYLFSPVDGQSCIFGFKQSLCLFKANQGITSRTLASEIKFLTHDGDRILAELCDGSLDQYEAGLRPADIREYFPGVDLPLFWEIHPTRPLIAYGVDQTTKTIRIADRRTSDVKLETPGESVVFMNKYFLVKAKAEDQWNVYDLDSFQFMSRISTANLTASPAGNCLLIWDRLEVVRDQQRMFLRGFAFNQNIDAAAFSPDDDRLYIMTSEFRVNDHGSDEAVYLLYRFNLAANDVTGNVILKLDGKPVHGQVLWVY